MPPRSRKYALGFRGFAEPASLAGGLAGSSAPGSRAVALVTAVTRVRAKELQASILLTCGAYPPGRCVPSCRGIPLRPKWWRLVLDGFPIDRPAVLDLNAFNPSDPPCADCRTLRPLNFAENKVGVERRPSKSSAPPNLLVSKRNLSPRPTVEKRSPGALSTQELAVVEPGLSAQLETGQRLQCPSREPAWEMRVQMQPWSRRDQFQRACHQSDRYADLVGLWLEGLEKSSISLARLSKYIAERAGRRGCTEP